MHENAPIISRRGRFRRPAHLFRLVLLAGLLSLACAACQPVQAVSGVAPAGEAESDVVVVAETQADIQPAGVAEVAGADAAVSEPTAPPAAILDEALVQRGLEVYRAQYCGICHALGAAGTTGRFGPEHDGMGTIAEERITAANYSGGATNAEEYLYESLVKPEVFIVDGYASSSHRMPPYTHLSEEDLLALTAFLLAQQ
jgi:mono/diheme cytochrome c family protein